MLLQVRGQGFTPLLSPRLHGASCLSIAQKISGFAWWLPPRDLSVSNFCSTKGFLVIR